MDYLEYIKDLKEKRVEARRQEELRQREEQRAREERQEAVVMKFLEQIPEPFRERFDFPRRSWDNGNMRVPLNLGGEFEILYLYISPVLPGVEITDAAECKVLSIGAYYSLESFDRALLAAVDTLERRPGWMW